MTEQKIPDGYLQTSQGYLVPIDKVPDIELLKNDLVLWLVANAWLCQDAMRVFKTGCLDDIQAFMELAASEYNIKYGGTKGNLSLVSFDGQFKVQIAVDDTVMFDEKLQIAKQLIDGCIHRWTANSDANLKALVEHAFQTDKQGNINTARVLGLLRLKIDDDEWHRAMEAIKDSIKVARSKSYLRFYQRVGKEGKYEQIALDMGGL
jgi:hypothetical protein